MFGLVVLAVAGLYFSLMFLTVRWAWRKGLAMTESRAKAFGYALAAFMVVYLPVFWDHIPTLVLHRYKCAQDARFTSLVEAKEWRARNAEAVAAVNRLPRAEREASIKQAPAPDGFVQSIEFGGLLRRAYRHDKVLSWLTVGRSEQRITDVRTGEVLAVAIDYAAGTGSPDNLRWWTQIDSCVARAPSVAGQPDRPTQPFSLLIFFEHALREEQP